MSANPVFSSPSQETNEHSVQPLTPAEVEGVRFEFCVQPITEREEALRHSEWRLQRRQVFTALQKTGQKPNVIDSFVNCGSGCRVLVNLQNNEVRLAANYCHNRFCVPCGVSRSRLIAAHLVSHMPDSGARFITLTLRHNHLPLRQQLDRLYASFRSLRRRRAWQDHVAGGGAFCELKLSERDHLWHVHLHIIALGSYWQKQELSREWYAVTGDSMVVDIRVIRDPGKVAGYVAKYAGKPLDSWTAAQPDALQEIVVSLKGRRMFTTFGSWRGIKFDQPIDPAVRWTDLGSYDQLCADAAAGDPHALRIWEALHRKKEWQQNDTPPDG